MILLSVVMSASKLRHLLKVLQRCSMLNIQYIGVDGAALWVITTIVFAHLFVYNKPYFLAGYITIKS